MSARPLVILLAGNPNSGKTSVFNWIAGVRQHVANYPGVTIEKKSARRAHQAREIEIIDLPGVYSLRAASPEEVIARDEILSGEAAVVIQVIDATNLERNLYLTAQLTELGVPLVFALNMSDEAAAAGLKFDLERMRSLLGGPVVLTNGSTGEGIPELLDAACRTADEGLVPVSRIRYGRELESALAAVVEQMEGEDALSARRKAIALLDGIPDPHVPARARAAAAAEIQRLEKRCGRPIDVQIAQVRYGFAGGVAREVTLAPAHHVPRRHTLRLDDLFLHRLWGFPIFLALMWGVFHLVFTLGEPPMHWIDLGLARLTALLQAHWPPTTAPLVRSLVADGILGGVGGVISFLPNILLLFLAIAFLEDSGYMARIAFLMDRIMHKMGLHGKSFVPMLIGLGCTVPAILATRTLESRRDRMITILIAPFISCGARLTIYALLIPAFFAPRWRGWVLWGVYVLGILAAIVAARLLGRVVFRGTSAPFVMELPPYRLPTWRTLAFQMWDRVWMYLHKAGTLILALSVILWAASTFPQRTVFSRDYEAAMASATNPEEVRALQSAQRAEILEYTAIGRFGKWIEPVIRPLGFDWRVGTALAGAFAAKEVFVAQMGIVFSLGEEDENPDSLRQRLRETYSPLQGLAMMIFCLLSAPCGATVIVVAREMNSWRWAAAMLLGMTIVAWLATFVVYSLGRAFGLGSA